MTGYVLLGMAMVWILRAIFRSMKKRDEEKRVISPPISTITVGRKGWKL